VSVDRQGTQEPQEQYSSAEQCSGDVHGDGWWDGERHVFREGEEEEEEEDEVVVVVVVDSSRRVMWKRCSRESV
jgi:hypothetical protein